MQACTGQRRALLAPTDRLALRRLQGSHTQRFAMGALRKQIFDARVIARLERRKLLAMLRLSPLLVPLAYLPQHVSRLLPRALDVSWTLNPKHAPHPRPSTLKMYHTLIDHTLTPETRLEVDTLSYSRDTLSFLETPHPHTLLDSYSRGAHHTHTPSLILESSFLILPRTSTHLNKAFFNKINLRAERCTRTLTHSLTHSSRHKARTH